MMCRYCYASNEEDAKNMSKLRKKIIVTWDDFVMSDDVCIAVAESLGLSVTLVRVP